MSSRAGLLRAVGFLGVAALCLVATYRLIGPWRAAWITRVATGDPRVYEQAIALDPDNAEYHFLLAQIYYYSAEFFDRGRARLHFDSAIGLNPERSRYWLEASKFYEQEGEAASAQRAMQKALELDPNYAQTHWAAANLFLRQGDVERAEDALAASCRLDEGFVLESVDLAWRLHGDAGRIVRRILPGTSSAATIALGFFVAERQEPAAAEVWETLKLANLRLRDVLRYTEFLIEVGKPHQAHEVFVHPFGQGETAVPFNGSFETDPVNAGFDWRSSSIDHAEVRRDSTTAKDGMHSLMISFDGRGNPDFANVWQWLAVERGKAYELQLWMRTDSITSSEGVFVEVAGRASEKKSGTNFWEELRIPFHAPSDLVAVRVRREASQKLDSLIRGRVWVDHFVLIERE